LRHVCYVDGGAWPNPGPGAAAACLADEGGQIICEAVAIIEGETTSMRSEYHALRKGIMLAILAGAEECHFVTDCQVMAQQIAGLWVVRDEEIGLLHAAASVEIRRVPRWSVTFVPREENKRADWLVNTILRPGDKRALREPERRVEFRAGPLREGWASMQPSRYRSGVGAVC
jgi:ribonuclease HI